MDNSFQHSFVTRSHKGIYAVIRKKNKILVIKKARGPYTGLYDLPGGSPELDETPEQTLAREIKEETNCDLISFSNKREKTIFFSQFTKESGEIGCIQHTGILFDANVLGNPSLNGDGLDSDGAIWIDIDTLSSRNATPFLLIACPKEVICLSNESGYPTDAIVRGEPLPLNRFPMISGVFLFNSKGNIILQKIALTKKTDPGKWSYSAAGHVGAGETYKQAALREIEEEMGIKGAIPVFLGKGYTTKDGKPRAFHHVFKIVSDDPISFDETEVDEIKEFSVSELKKEIIKNPNNFKDIFAKLFMDYINISGL